MRPLSKKSWRQLSAEERERALSPSSCIGGNYQPFIAAYASESRAAVSSTTLSDAVWQTLPYGEKPTQTITLCTPAAEQCRGLLIFIHGGYWQELSAQDSLFPAAGCIERNIAFAAVNYTLCPHASVTEIVAECVSAVSYLQRQARSFGFEPNRIVISGSSAGAHLAAMVCASLATPLRGAVFISGIYELEPLLGTSINEALHMDIDEALRNSPLFMQRKTFPRTIMSWGEIETDEFKRQSAEFARALVEEGVDVNLLEVADRNHFDVIMGLADSHSPLGTKTLALFDERK
jgi:arylformamidase